MRKILSTIAVLMLAAGVARAQETNALRTQLENFEAQTNTVIVKGFGQIGSVALGAGTLSVRSKESIDVSHARKLYGLMIELDSEAMPRHQFAVVDEDEMDSLVNGLDYLLKITSDVTVMPSFEAHYTTRSGLRFSAHGSRHQSGIQFFLRLDDNPKISFTTDQLNQIRNLISQARNGINALK